MYSSFDAVTDILVVAVIWVPALYLLGRAEARARATESARRERAERMNATCATRRVH